MLNFLKLILGGFIGAVLAMVIVGGLASFVTSFGVTSNRSVEVCETIYAIDPSTDSGTLAISTRICVTGPPSLLPEEELEEEMPEFERSLL